MLPAGGRRWQRLLSTVIGAGAVACCMALAWRHRVELFFIPHLWRQVRELAAMREAQPEHPAFAPTEAHGLSPFDRLLSRLIRLQRPAFRGGKSFHLVPIGEGSTPHAWITYYEPSIVPFDAPVAPIDPDAPEMISLHGCN